MPVLQSVTLPIDSMTNDSMTNDSISNDLMTTDLITIDLITSPILWNSPGICVKVNRAEIAANGLSLGIVNAYG